jgi:hypothetical protein
MQLTTSNLNVNSSISTGILTTNNVTVNSQAIAISGTPIISETQISMGDVTITPSIGISTPLLYMGGSALGLGTVGITNAQFFTANGTWVKPAGANNADPRNQVLIMMWGAGGCGRTSSGANSGGGGGACVLLTLPLSSFDDNCSVTVGPDTLVGQASVSSVFVVNSTCNVVAYGGVSALANNSPGGGGGWLSTGSTITGGGPLGGGASTDSTFGGGGGVTTTLGNAGRSIFGGGGGAAHISTSGGDSVYGGGGGSDFSQRGKSVLGGDGADYILANTTAIPAKAPGGGGGLYIGATTGARGEVRVWLIGPGPI